MQYLNADQVMEKFKISRATLFRYRQKGMPYHKEGTTLLFNKEEVKTWMDLHLIKKDDTKVSMYGKGINIQKKFVKLSGFLPEFPELKGSCALEFSRIDGIITLNPEDIMGLLTKGLETSYNDGLRPYIIHSPFDKNKPYQIRLRGFAAFLNEAEIREFCETIDTYMSHYLFKLEEILDIVNPKGFPLSSINTNDLVFRLFEIDKQLWKKMIKFTRMFPIDQSNNQLRFESSDHFIRIFNLEGMPSENYHVILRPEQLETIYFNPVAPTDDDKIWLVAEVPHNYSLEIKGLSDINLQNLWDTTITESWLKDYFVPSVISYFEGEKMEQPFNLFSVLKDTFKREKETTIYNRKKYEIGINKHTFSSTLGNRLISPFDINSEKQLNDLISILQSYYCSANVNFKLTAEEIQNLYQALLNCLDNLNENNKVYPEWLANRVMIQNIKSTNIEDLCKSIHEHIKKSTNPEIYHSIKIENILRCFLEVTSDGKISFSSEEDLQQTARMLYPIFKKMQQQKLYESLQKL